MGFLNIRNSQISNTLQTKKLVVHDIKKIVENSFESHSQRVKSPPEKPMSPITNNILINVDYPKGRDFES